MASAFNVGSTPKKTQNPNADRIKLTGRDKIESGREEQISRSMKAAQYEPAYQELLELLFRYTGQGSLTNQTELFFSRFDRYGTNTLSANVEHAGLTFFSRPKLPLTRGNLSQCPSLIGLDSYDKKSYAFAIRCWLDTKFSRSNGPMGGDVAECPFFDQKSAINIPLSNACVAQSGWPDPFIQTFTTTGGFFQEDQTFPIGSDRLRKTYDLNFTFKETQGGPILAMLYAWYEVMACLCEGSMVAYSEDIDAQRMCYTCSIYRFLLDPSKSHITHYAKATGCFPKAPPMGALFNQSKGEVAVQAASEISIPFVCNKVEYDDPRILLDFNLLMTRYCPDISSYPILRPEPYNNFKGYPFVISSQYGLEMAFREFKDQAYEDSEISRKMMATTREKFELYELFYPNLKSNLGNITDKDGKPLTIDQILPRGPETRYLYRITKDEEGETQYYLDPQDEYGKETPLPNNPQLDPTANKDLQYGGVPADDGIAQLIKDTKVALRGYKGDGDVVVEQFAPVFVTGDQAGLIDQAAVKRALARADQSNRDIVDAGTTPNPRITMDRTSEAAANRAKLERENVLASITAELNKFKVTDGIVDREPGESDAAYNARKEEYAKLKSRLQAVAKS